MTTILKVGGSLITDKAGTESLDREGLSRVCGTIADCGDGELIIVHGGGSFGHRAASEHGIAATTGSREPGDVRAVMAAMDSLHGEVLKALLAAGVPATGLPPRALAAKDEDGAVSVDTTAVRAFLRESFIPVLHGDVVAHRGRGASVLSGDALLVALADRLEVERAGFCTGVPGVLDGEGAVIPRVRTAAELEGVLDEPPGADVTGGMGAKVRAVLELERPAAIFGIDGLGSFLDGELPGTVVGSGGDDAGPF